MVALRWHRNDLGSDGITLGIIYGSKWILLSAIRLCRMVVTPSMHLDLCRSMHQIIPSLLMDEHEDLKSKFLDWFGNIKG